MSLSSNEAAATLRDIESTQRRSANAFGYRMAAPHLILWGIIWALGYGVTAVHREWSILWIALTIMGVVASTWIGVRTSHTARGHVDPRPLATVAAVALLIASLFAILHPLTGAQISAFFPIVVGFAYALIGIWTGGARTLITGVVIVALTLVGFFALPSIFTIWMAIVGGGALVLGGVWLRTV
ncbi:MAG TPA: hypothetical protein VFK13_09735 [Gemmatimonadaceae bacterium]|nr:hypothetical protein [Gemmatimonadaceae bacterium]